MKESSNKKAIILYGPPGSGKGTTAALLARNYNFIHFDTGQYIEQLLYNPQYRKNKAIQEQRKLFETGKLCTPSWVLKIVSEAAKNIAAVGWSVVFSGSPRTVFEAFGDKKNTGLMKILEKIYGRKNIFIFELKVSAQTSIKRNSNRVICSVCGQPSLFLYTGRTKCCAVCAGPFKKRTLDNPKVIKARLIEYQERTFPILKGLKKDGYKIFSLDGEPAPYKVFEKIIPHIKS